MVAARVWWTAREHQSPKNRSLDSRADCATCSTDWVDPSSRKPENQTESNMAVWTSCAPESCCFTLWWCVLCGESGAQEFDSHAGLIFEMKDVTERKMDPVMGSLHAIPIRSKVEMTPTRNFFLQFWRWWKMLEIVLHRLQSLWEEMARMLSKVSIWLHEVRVAAQHWVSVCRLIVLFSTPCVSNDRFASGIVYYGLSLSTSTLAGDKYVNFFISGAVEAPAYMATIFVLQK